MSVYQWLHRHLPRTSYSDKVLVLVVATQLPLLVVLTAVMLTVGGTLPLLLVILSGLTAMLVLLTVLHQVLSPVIAAADALESYLNDRTIPDLPTDTGDDDAGRLVRNVVYTCHRFEEERVWLEGLAREDGLTGVLNRAAGQTELLRAASLARRQGLEMCVAMIDLDHFKQVNDTLGHAAGDIVLQRTAQRLQDQMRGSDWVTRWGGEEFLVVMFAPLRGAVDAMERVLDALALPVAAVDPVRHDPWEHTPTASIGVAAFDLTEDVLECVARADRALFDAKAAGRNCVMSQGEASLHV